MRTITKLACPLAILAAFAVASTPARAQFAGDGDQMAQFGPMMEQLAPLMEQAGPMLQMMQRKIGKKRISQMMQMVGPMMAGMAQGGGGGFGGPSGMGGGFGGPPSMGGTGGMPSMMSMMSGEGPTRHARKRKSD